MRSSNGGITLGDIMNLRYCEMFEYSQELSKLIEKENKELRKK